VITRAEIVDFLVRDGESLVLTPQQCVRLTEVPTAILELLAEPRTRAQLEKQITAAFGAPPPGRLDQVLSEMAGQGLIRL